MPYINEMRLDFTAQPQNEAFARLAVSGFLLPLDPTMEELADIKTAVSEAVTNAIVHGYGGRPGIVRVAAGYAADGTFTVEVIDRGRGIEDVQRAMQPFFTTSADDERSGMGFTVMQSFMDEVDVRSAAGRGTVVRLVKHMRARETDAVPRRA